MSLEPACSRNESETAASDSPTVQRSDASEASTSRPTEKSSGAWDSFMSKSSPTALLSPSGFRVARQGVVWAPCWWGGCKDGQVPEKMAPDGQGA